MTSSVCTLFEGNYHIGLGALLNSLFRNGFRGTLFAGYRGDLPPWAAPASTKEGITDFPVGEGCKIRFVSLDTSLHLASYKPIFMRRLFEQFLPADDDLLCYFDPDITVKCRWTFFEEWVSNGLAMVEDSTFPYMPSDHPLRYKWLEMARAAGMSEKRAPSRYYNSGFVGVPGRLRHVVSIWESLIDAAQGFGYNTKHLASTDRTSPWQATDQDLLNVVVMTTDVPLSTLGPEGMDFRPGGYVMSHAVNSPKPWARDYVKFALQGKPPSLSDKGFWENSEYPIRLFPESIVRKRNLALKAAIAMGRVWHRP